MKLRVKGNSLIFRVTRAELTKLNEAGRIDETIYFSADQGSKVVYALSHDSQITSISLRYQHQEILILLPSKQLDDWIMSEEKAVYTKIDLGTRDAIECLLEKDYELWERS